ncbi:IclR family transcriptional regulator [Streptomyces sp. PA03-6a]|nr:IclR family transcriptional regulator [Streptomyces sp. PA03-6a]
MREYAHEGSPDSSVSRALRILAVVADRGEARLGHISAAVGIPASTAHRLLGILESSGHVVRAAGSGHRAYLAGPALFDLAAAQHRAEEELVTRAEPYLAALAAELGETVQVAALRGTRTRFLAGHESTRSLRTGLRLGLDHPAVLSSPGRAILARMPPEDLRRLLGSEAESAEVASALDDTRRQGYGLNIGNVEADITAIGAAVVDRSGRIRGALAVAGPSTRLPESTAHWIGPILVREATRLGTELGGGDRPPVS